MKKNENDIFIDGKNQAIQILQGLTQEERNRLLGLLRTKNPLIAQELESRSHSFMDLLASDNESLKIIFEYVSAPVIGIAISNIPTEEQRRILKLLNRDKAETAFKVFRSRRSTNQETEKAQNKISNVAAELADRGLVIL